MADPSHPDIHVRRADRAGLQHLIELREEWRGRDAHGLLALQLVDGIR